MVFRRDLRYSPREDSRACAKSVAVRQAGVVIGASRQGGGIQRATVQKSA
jgi:hypothetical protein